ncbi:helix-turn-helix domain-containing protein [Methanobrevibacter sp.]|uniref:winged helix-turn-helix transcriptional regulator n=1 Tax=Methanobrevibacter sp. TaxID=66852 RepID=UPI0026DF75D1|nr:helix-turn-helix domain-containing protein [Methanobrevibacter sp.]MDO5823235.1 helix-turn-helix domain-containing protein [Methanobrevibacter sp.]
MNANAQLNSFPIDNVIQLIRKKWVVQIINDLFFGKSRFHEFKEDKPKLSNRVLSSCLKDMEDNGLIKRIADKYDKKNVRYYLTEKGRSLNKIMYEMAIFSVDRENYTDKTKTELKSVFREKLL